MFDKLAELNMKQAKIHLFAAQNIDQLNLLIKKRRLQ
jgi:hypothetical protein